MTEAIRAAVFEELAAVGYARMSIEGIARRAGVGKTAVYRRWRSKLHLVLDLVSAIAVQGLPAPDTGTLEGDLRLLYEVTSRALRHPVASQIIPDLQAEAARNPEIAEAMQKALREGQEGVASGIVAAAERRGEVRIGHRRRAGPRPHLRPALLALGGDPRPEAAEGLSGEAGAGHGGGAEGLVGGVALATGRAVAGRVVARVAYREPDRCHP